MIMPVVNCTDFSIVACTIKVSASLPDCLAYKTLLSNVWDRVCIVANQGYKLITTSLGWHVINIRWFPVTAELSYDEDKMDSTGDRLVFC